MKYDCNNTTRLIYNLSNLYITHKHATKPATDPVIQEFWNGDDGRWVSIF